MPLPGFLNSIVGWLRAGYPEGVPQRDYLPLFALLASQLSSEELRDIATELEGEADPTSKHAIRDAIEMVTHEQPSDADIADVRAHLARGGWPLADPQRVTPDS